MTLDSPWITATFARIAPTSIKTKAIQPSFGAARRQLSRIAEAK